MTQSPGPWMSMAILVYPMFDGVGVLLFLYWFFVGRSWYWFAVTAVVSFTALGLRNIIHVSYPHLYPQKQSRQEEDLEKADGQ